MLLFRRVVQQLVFVLPLLWIAPTQASEFVAYVANQADNTVSVIDTTTNTVVSTIPVGNSPQGVAAGLDGAFLYVANKADNTISVVDTSTGSTVKTVSTHSPTDFSNIVGSKLYVNNQLLDTISELDTSNNTIVATINVGRQPAGIAINPINNRGYVANQRGDTVSVFDTNTNQVLKTISVGIGPSRIVVHPSGAFVYVSNRGNPNIGPGSVSVIATSTDTVVQTIAMPIESVVVVISNSGDKLYVGNRVANQLSVVDTASNTITSTIPVGNFPTGIAVHPTSDAIYVVNQLGGDVSVIDPNTHAIIDTIAVGNNPIPIAIAPSFEKAPVADAGVDQTIRSLGETVNLDGSGSFDDNTSTANLLYAWQFETIPVGSSATLSGAGTVSPSFIADLSGAYEIALIVTDEAGLASVPDIVSVSTNNLAPTADAGPDLVVPVGDIVALDGSNSFDPENDPLDFLWSFNATPAGSTAPLFSDNTQNPFFTPDVAGGYTVSLTVSDALGAGVPDAADITALDVDDFANQQITDAADLIVNLPPTDVTTSGNQNAMTNFLAQAAAAIQAGDFAEAVKKLNDLLNRTDGCELRGAPDGNGPGRDWILNCAAQAETYMLLTAAIAALS